jgi:hypothetical protein
MKFLKNIKKRIVEGLFSYISDYDYRDDNFGSEWIPLGLKSSTVAQIEEILYQNLDKIRTISRQLWYENEHYKGIIRTYIKYIAGKSITVESENESENKLWSDFTKRFQFRRFMKEWVRRLFRDGETFLYLPTMKFIDPTLIVEPAGVPNASYGIEADENGKEIAFYVQRGSSIEKIPGELILHSDDTDDDQKRGVPYLITLSKRSIQYNDLLESRIKLNQIRASIALVRKHEGASPSSVKTFADTKKMTH